MNPYIFILYIGSDGRLFFEGDCRTIAQYVVNDRHDDTAYIIYSEIVTQIMDIILEIPGGADWLSYIDKLKMLPNIERLPGRDFLHNNPAITKILREHTYNFGISLYFHMRDQEFLSLSSLYTVNFEYQLSRDLNLDQLIMVKFSD